MALLTVVMVASFSSCSDDDDQLKTSSIVGKWVCSVEDDDESFSMVLTLNSDATGTIEELFTTRASYSYNMKFSWSTATDSNGDTTLKVSYISGDKVTELFPGSSSTALWSRQYVLTGDILNIYQGDGVWVFNRM